MRKEKNNGIFITEKNGEYTIREYLGTYHNGVAKSMTNKIVLNRDQYIEYLSKLKEEIINENYKIQEISKDELSRIIKKRSITSENETKIDFNNKSEVKRVIFREDPNGNAIINSEKSDYVFSPEAKKEFSNVKNKTLSLTEKI